MSFNAKLKFGGKDGIDVLACDYVLRRDVDAKGRPSSGVYGGTIKLSIESTEDTTIVESMVNQYKPIDGAIVFKKSDEDAKMKEVKWEKGYVIEFHEAFVDKAQDKEKAAKPMQIDFVISAQKISIGNAEHKNEWPA
ncbi:type VI secretion system tube protein TssD [Foetidibacter luteolus]|uniref:type VI secretion system tube protein TssD n=1 Tax=Foetidibacter luteolus TaxID=2608880 RepID=UPI00129A6279|nr:type VI secretion system tube protein TssD [Foetidibacter luteolus]